jgi:hypothetical protein
VFRTSETGTNLYVGNALIDHFLPEEVDSNLVGRNFGKDVVIVDVVRKGTVFQIARCYESGYPENAFRQYQVRFDDVSLGGALLDISDLTDMTVRPPVFREEFAEPVK